MDFESHLSRVLLGESAVPPPGPRPASSARPIIPGRRPVSVLGVQSLSSSFNSPPPFPNLLSSLTDRPQPLSPTTTITNSKTPASRYIRPARCLTDSILSSSSSIDSLLGNSAPRTPPPATAPRPPTPVATTPVATTPVATTPVATTPVATTPVATIPVATIPVSPSPGALAVTTAAATESEREPVASLEAPVETAAASPNPKHIQIPAPGETPVQKPKADSITGTENSVPSAVTHLDLHAEHPDLQAATQDLLQEQGLIHSQAESQKAPVPAGVESSPTSSHESQLAHPESSPPTPAKAVEAAPPPTQKRESPAPAIDTPPPTPSRKGASPSPLVESTSTETEVQGEGDSFRDFRVPQKSVPTPPPSPSTSRPAFGRLSFGSSFSSLVQAVTSATAQSNMGLTGDGRSKPSKPSSGQNGVFGGWLQKRASAAHMTVTEAKGEDEAGGLTPNRSRSTSTVSKLTIGKENAANGVNGCSNMSTAPLRSSASSVVEGSSRPTTPQKSPGPGSALISPARQKTKTLDSIPEPPHPALVDEFQGLSFPTLVNSFRTPPPSKLADQCERSSAEDRLEELANMAQDLLVRMYTAYTKRTSALEEVLADQGVLKEEVEERKVKARHLQSQLDHVSQDAEKTREEKDEVIGILVKELENEKIKMEEERRDWEEERQKWREIEREKLRAELLMEMLAAQGVSSDAVEEGDTEMTPRGKRISTGGASSDSGFDESDKSDADSFYSMAKGEAAAQNGGVVAKNTSLASMTITSTEPSTPTRAGRSGNSGEKSGKMVPSPLLNPAPLSAVRCENCSRISFTSRPSSPSPSITSFSSPPLVVPGSVNPSRFPALLSKNNEPPQQPSAPPSATSTTASSSRWGFGVLRGGNGNNGVQELDRLRGENKNLRERVGDLEKSVDDVLGVLGGWRS